MIYRPGQLVVLSCIAAGVLFAAEDNVSSQAQVEVRVCNFTVPPSTGPLTHILVRHTLDTAQTVTVQPKFPDGWQWAPKQRTVTLKAGQVERVPFTIEKAVDLDSNRYPVEVTIGIGHERKVHRQTIVCASAPYFKPKIDGKFKDWSDAIPATFTTEGKKTIVSTYWNKKYFYLYVQVEEDKLYSYKKNASFVDGLQVAIARRDTVTQSGPGEKAQRYELLFVNLEGMFAKDKCFFLLKPGEELSLTQKTRPLDSLEFEEARVVVKRQGKITHYECAIPFAAMPQIKPETGREIALSILVHDPDGTGVRDWGRAAGLWPWQRNRFAWCTWGSVKWAEAPYDSKVEWGLCSSKH